MIHFFEAITNTKGDALVGYVVRVVDRSTGSVVSIYADEGMTPIESVSGIANAAEVDSNGNVSFYVAPDTYHLDIYGADGSTLYMRVSDIGMTSTQGEKGDQGDKGDPGANVMSIGTFAQASALVIPTGTAMVRVSGTATDGDLGANRLFVADAGVTPTFVTNNPLIAFRDATGRGFREINPANGKKLLPFVLVISGQSSAAGANNDGPNPASPGVKTWNGATGAWGGSSITAAPWTLPNPHGNESNNNYALAMAHRIYEETRRPVFIIFDAVGGRSIDEWTINGTSSTRYAALIAKVVAALATPELSSHGITKVDAMIWAQGEEDFDDTFQTHLDHLTTLDTQLRAESWMDKTTPVYFTGSSALHDRYAPMRALRYYSGSVNRWCIYVSSNGMSTAVNAHFTGLDTWRMGYYALAERYLKGGVAEEIPSIPFYGITPIGELSPGDVTGCTSTFNSIANWDSRTDGPDCYDLFAGTGAQTAFTLLNRTTGITAVRILRTFTGNGSQTAFVVSNTIASLFSVQINGTTADASTYSFAGSTVTFTTAPANGATVSIEYTTTAYSVATTLPGLPVLTFTNAPSSGTTIRVNYGVLVDMARAPGGFNWGMRCYADGANTAAFGAYTYTDNGATRTIVGGNLTAAMTGASDGLYVGSAGVGRAAYQFGAGRGYDLVSPGEVSLGLFPKYTDGSYLFQYGVGTSTAARKTALAVTAAGNVGILAPSTATDPAQNEEISFKRISNTSLQILMRGTDGTVRTVSLTLA